MAGLIFGPEGLGAEKLSYFTELEPALNSAAKAEKRIILFTGAADNCRGLTPRQYFEQRILATNAALKARINDFIVCERFIYSPMQDVQKNFTKSFQAEMLGWFDQLDKKYDIRFLTATVTILTPGGTKISGPFDPWARAGDSFTKALSALP